ncbi:LAMI_0B01288g1_1 [Lachancea mirantina]|uniref:THO complex subunit 2 n=1 Tax=Lachancea mirantina TaxID=1230905 RepID=A0A1G4ITU3_9SACH|nr:LAMI_0B01288g1_1 [Lachancea mirantina]
MSIVEGRITGLAASGTEFLSSKFIFDEEFSVNWKERSAKLMNELRDAPNEKEAEDKIKLIFYDCLLLTADPNAFQSTIDLTRLSALVTEVCSMNSPRNAKVFISMINSFPDKTDRLVELMISLPSLNDAFSTYISDDKLLERAGKFTAQQRGLFKRQLLESRYIIKKYNLLGEHAVGFSSLITFLFTAYNDGYKDMRVKYYWSQMQCIIGKYSLDPIKSLEVILRTSAFYLPQGYKFLVEFLRASDFWPQQEASHLEADSNLGRGGSIVAAKILSELLNDRTIEVQVYDMCCVLIKCGFISFGSIFENIGPDDEKINDYTEKRYRDLESESNQGILNPLAMAAALADDSEGKAEENNEQRQNYAKFSATTQEEAITEDIADSKKEVEKRIFYGGKLLLLERLIVHGLTIPFMYGFLKFQRLALLKDSLVKELIKAFDFALTPLYKSMVFGPELNKDHSVLSKSKFDEPQTPGHRFREVKSHDTNMWKESNFIFSFYHEDWGSDVPSIPNIEALFQLSHEWLSSVGPRLAVVPTTISKLCRMALRDIETNSSAENISRWVDYFRKFIFPALPLLSENLPTVNEVYNVMRLFRFETRCYLYNEMYSKLSQDELFIKVAWNKYEKKARSALKSLSVDNIDLRAPGLGKLVSANPLSALHPIVNQIENYDKVSELVVKTSLFFSPFAYDVLQYILLSRLTSGRAVVQADGINLLTWLSRLANFIAELVKNCPKMDVGNIVRFIVKTLRQGSDIPLVILRQLLFTVAGIKSQYDVNKKQLIMLNSGKPLQLAARRIIRDVRDDNRRCSKRLLTDFIALDSLTEIVIILYRLQLRLMFEDTHYKVLSSKCDDMNSLLWSFISTCKYFLDAKTFEDHVLPFSTLVNDQNVSIEWAFELWRDFYLKNQTNNNPTDLIEDEMFFISDKTKYGNLEKPLFLSFWIFSLHEVHFDRSVYDEEKIYLETIKRQTKSDKKLSELSKKIENLMASCLSHQATFNRTSTYLVKVAEKWNWTKAEMKDFIQLCMVPRVLFSPCDAMYAFYFASNVFKKAGVFRIFEMLVNSGILRTLLFSSTTHEASNIGFFLEMVTEYLSATKNEEESGFDSLFDLHNTLLDDLVDILMEKNYMSIRNGIECMKYFSNVFPIATEHIEYLIWAIERYLVEDQREDIKLPSNALVGHLKARLKSSSSLRSIYHFELKDEDRAFLAEKEEIAQYERLVRLGSEKVASTEPLELNEENKAESLSEQEVSAPKEKDQTVIVKKSTRFDATQNLPMFEVLDEMDEILEHLKADDMNLVKRRIRNKNAYFELRSIENKTSSLEDYRSGVADLLEDYFRSLVSNFDHERFTYFLSEIANACQSISLPREKKASKNRKTAKIEYGNEISGRRDTKTSNPASNARESSANLKEDRRESSRYGGAGAQPLTKSRFSGSGAPLPNEQSQSAQKLGKSPDTQRNRGSKMDAANPDLSERSLRSNRTGTRFEGLPSLELARSSKSILKRHSSPRAAEIHPPESSSARESRYNSSSVNQIEINDKRTMGRPSPEISKRKRPMDQESNFSKRSKPSAETRESIRFPTKSSSKPHGSLKNTGRNEEKTMKRQFGNLRTSEQDRDNKGGRTSQQSRYRA